MTSHAIQLKGVSKAFAARPAVIDLSLDVEAGSIYGLLGHNGAGKSTTLGMLLGQVFPDHGDVKLHGCNVFEDRRGALSRVGAIFESPCFYDYLSGIRNLRIFTSYTAHVPRQRLEHIIDLVGLTERIGHKVATYSHGMRQRLALAQALLPDPATLILDEPTDGLDPQGIAEFRRVIQRIHREQGMTILFSSHLLSEVEQLCDKVAVIHRGRRVFEGNWQQAQRQSQRLELETTNNDDALRLLREAGLITADPPDHAGRVVMTPHTTPRDINRFLLHRGHDVSRLAVARLSLEDFYMTTVQTAEATPS